MALTYLWHQLHLHRKKVVGITFLLATLLSQAAWAQGPIKGQNLPGYENKRLRWGFSLGVNSSWYSLEHSQTYVDNISSRGTANEAGTSSDSSYSAQSKSGIGFNVNFIASYRLSSDFVLRVQPGVGYYSRSVVYNGQLDGPNTAPREAIQEINSFAGELPILIKYESLRRKNTQMYFIGGIKPVVVVGGQKGNRDDILNVGKSDFTIEMGVGLDMFYPYFKFAPELRFSRGITEQHEAFNNVYNNAFKRITTNTLTLYLNFE